MRILHTLPVGFLVLAAWLVAAQAAAAQNGRALDTPTPYYTRPDAPQLLPIVTIDTVGPLQSPRYLGNGAAVDGDFIALGGPDLELATPRFWPVQAGGLWVLRQVGAGGYIVQDLLRPDQLDSMWLGHAGFGVDVDVLRESAHGPATAIGSNQWSFRREGGPSPTFALAFEQDPVTGRMIRVASLDIPPHLFTGDFVVGFSSAHLHEEREGSRHAFAGSPWYYVVVEHRRDPATGTWIHAGDIEAPPARRDSARAFGHAIATDDGLLVIGAPFDREAGLDRGAAYVYERDAPDEPWRFSERLTRTEVIHPFDGYYAESVGAVTLDDGHQIVLAATGALPPSLLGVDIFQRSGTGQPWKHTGVLTNGRNNWTFMGARMNVVRTPSGVLACVQDGPNSVGRIYVFHRDNASGVWTHLATASKPPTAVRSLSFLDRCNVDRDGRMVVGHYQEIVGGQDYMGAAYVYDLSPLLPVAGNAPPPVEPSAGVGIVSVRPNPSSREAVVRYRTASEGPVGLVLLDALGREVAHIAAGTRPAGEHEARFDVSALPPGVYAVRVEAGGSRAVRRLVVAR